MYVNPRNTSKLCPRHGAIIRYNDKSRIGTCSAGGEKWHRDVVVCLNLYLKALSGDVGNALSRSGFKLDGSPVPLGSTATCEFTWVFRSMWTRWKPNGNGVHEKFRAVQEHTSLRHTQLCPKPTYIPYHLPTRDPEPSGCNKLNTLRKLRKGPPQPPTIR